MKEQPIHDVGLIGLDTSHCESFADLLMDVRHPHHVPGARVMAAFPGGSPDFELCYSRVDGFTTKLRDGYGIEIVGTPEEVAERCTLLLITAGDGRTHRGYFERTAAFRRPTFIDKPFATSVADAKAILAMAERSDVPVMSCSSLRYADTLRAALNDAGQGQLLGIDVHGPMSLQPTQPGYFWYGIHSIDMMIAALGPGCSRVCVTHRGDHEVLTAEWNDGRVATYHGLHKGHTGFGAVLHRERGRQLVDASATARPAYVSLIESILSNLPSGRSDVPKEEILEVVRVIMAANRSRDTRRMVTIKRGSRR